MTGGPSGGGSSGWVVLAIISYHSSLWFGGAGMARGTRITSAAALVAALLAAIPSPAPAASVPRWVLHAERFPGGLSQGVRAYALHPAPAGSTLGSQPASPAITSQGTVDNVQANTDPGSLPQNETAVAYDSSDPMLAVAAANGYVNDSLWIAHTSDGGQHCSRLFKTPP